MKNKILAGATQLMDNGIWSFPAVFPGAPSLRHRRPGFMPHFAAGIHILSLPPFQYLSFPVFKMG